jgi:hypothetical protein
MLIPGMLAKRALKGTLPIIGAARSLQDELLAPALVEPSDAPFHAERQAVAAMKKTGLMILGTAMQTYGAQLSEEQEVLLNTADILIDILGADSVLHRASAAGTSSGRGIHEAAARVFINDAAARVEIGARTALAGMTEGDTLRTMLAALRRIIKVAPVNTIALRRTVADAVVQRKGYPFA